MFTFGKPSINGPFSMAILNNQRVSQFANYFWVGIALVSLDHRTPLHHYFCWYFGAIKCRNQPTNQLGQTGLDPIKSYEMLLNHDFCWLNSMKS